MGSVQFVSSAHFDVWVALSVQTRKGTEMTSFDVFLFYGPAHTVNAAPYDNFDDAAKYGAKLAEKLGADGYAVYDPRDDSNEHFPGPCLKTVHSYGHQVHRPNDLHSALIWATNIYWPTLKK